MRENLGEFDCFLFGLSSFANPLLESYEQLLGGLATQPVGSRFTQATQAELDTHADRFVYSLPPVPDQGNLAEWLRRKT